MKRAIFSFAGLLDDLQDAVLRLDGGEVVQALQGMDVEDVQVVGAQPLEARLDLTLRLVPLARGDLGLEEDLAAPGRHQATHALLALAVPVVVGGVDVREARVDGSGQHPTASSSSL